MNITIKTIPHKDQRYDTAGDYFLDEHGDLQVRISKLPDWRFGACVIVHELIELFMCRFAGVPFDAIDDFDKNYELHRPAGDESEPGDDPAAPYHFQHQVASGVERIFAGVMGVNWAEYDRAINDL